MRKKCCMYSCKVTVSGVVFVQHGLRERALKRKLAEMTHITKKQLNSEALRSFWSSHYGVTRFAIKIMKNRDGELPAALYFAVADQSVLSSCSSFRSLHPQLNRYDLLRVCEATWITWNRTCRHTQTHTLTHRHICIQVLNKISSR